MPGRRNHTTSTLAGPTPRQSGSPAAHRRPPHPSAEGALLEIADTVHKHSAPTLPRTDPTASKAARLRQEWCELEALASARRAQRYKRVQDDSLSAICVHSNVNNGGAQSRRLQRTSADAMGVVEDELREKPCNLTKGSSATGRTANALPSSYDSLDADLRWVVSSLARLMTYLKRSDGDVQVSGYLAQRLRDPTDLRL